MARHTSTSIRPTAAIAVTALAAAAIAAAGLGSAPTAHATCASFFGLGNSADCASTPLSIAIALGPNAKANAYGLFGAAFAVGSNTSAQTGNGAFDFAVAGGNDNSVLTTGVFGIGVALGPKIAVVTAGDPAVGNLGFNIAVNISPTNTGVYATIAAGVGNVATNLFGTSSGTAQSVASGNFSVANNLGGKDNKVLTSGGFLNTAFNLFGSNNTVGAGTGPLAIAGAIGQTGQGVFKQQPGININGFKLPNTAAALNSGKKARPAAASSRNDDNGSSGKRTTGGSGRSGR